MSKYNNIFNKTPSFWTKFKHYFQKSPTGPLNPITMQDRSILAIQQDLALLEDEDLDINTNKLPVQPETVEIEITFNDLQEALMLLKQQNQNLSTADEALKQLIDALQQSTKQKPEREVIIEFIPMPQQSSTAAFKQTDVIYYQEIKKTDLSAKLKQEQEQRELAKKITHYPPSDRLH